MPSPPILPSIDPQTLLAINAPLMPNEQSLGEVLFGFFAHYAVLPMDQALCIATAGFLPRPDAWKPDAFERFCILDPLSPDVDLGRHLTTDRSYRLRREFARARSELVSGTKLEDMINDPAFWRRKGRQLAAETPEGQARGKARVQARAQAGAEAQARGEARAQARAQAEAEVVAEVGGGAGGGGGGGAGGGAGEGGGGCSSPANICSSATVAARAVIRAKSAWWEQAWWQGRPGWARWTTGRTRKAWAGGEPRCLVGVV